MKIHFWPKTEKAENDQIAHFRRRNQCEFRSASSSSSEWPWPPQILRQIYATDVETYLGESENIYIVLWQIYSG